MKLKNNIILILLMAINFVTTLLLTIYVLPEKIPFLLDLSERIISYTSKWVMLTACFIPTIFIIVALIINHKKTQFFLKSLFILSIFENILYFSYFGLNTNIPLGTITEIPLSVSFFMPLSVYITILSVKLKKQPYLSKPAINFRVTKETEFIWKQTHIYARDVYFITGIILFFVSIIFSLIRYPLIELIIFILAILISTIIVYAFSKSIYNKYIEMKTKQDKLKNKSSIKNANIIEKNTKKSKKYSKNKKSIDGSNLM